MIVEGESADFDALLQRIHPAESRVRRLAAETPATYVIFDLLVDGRSKLFEQQLHARRAGLEEFMLRNFEEPVDRALTRNQRRRAGEAMAGGKPRSTRWRDRQSVTSPYAFGSRDAAVKIKRSYTADCVVGGFRTATDGTVVSLLLGLYDDDGLLHHIGFVGSMSAEERRRAAEQLKPIVEPPGFTGVAPGGPSRWRREENAEWFPVRPKVVVEVAFDHVTARRFRHAARLLRWRPDKPPRQCTMDQLLDPTELSGSQKLDRDRRPALTTIGSLLLVA